MRVSSKISNAPIILNLDCDMYSNDPDAVKDALCFFLDESSGKWIAYVQYPQRFSNITKHDIYANMARAAFQIEFAGIDGFGGTLYLGTGCFHRRESLLGKYCDNCGLEWENYKDNTKGKTVEELEVISKPLADCTYEKGTLWGKEMGLVYGCSVEDVVTGLTIQCRGWKPVYYNPSKKAFEGLGPATLDVALVQFKRWCEGMLQIFASKYCPFIYGYGKIKVGAQMGYCTYLLWAPMSLPTLYYATIPALYLLHDVPLFPQMWSFWFTPYAYVFTATTIYSLMEELMCGGTFRSWWNSQRMWLIRRITSYLFGLVGAARKQVGLSETSFDLTDKVMDGDDEARERYEKEIMEFGRSSSFMFIMLATVALLNLVGLAHVVVLSGTAGLSALVGQLGVCVLIVLLNFPVYDALFFRRDNGGLPFSLSLKALVLLLSLLTLLVPFS